VGTLNAPTSFAEYDPNTNAFTLISGPTGQTDGGAPYNTRLLDLPDGSVLFSNGGNRLYTYRPSGGPIAAAKPTITNVAHNFDGSYQVSGMLLMGISEGSEYGDDAQEATNYPIMRFTASNGSVYYGRTTRWNTTGVAKGGAIQSARFTTPPGMPAGSYSLQAVTNGVASDPIPFPSSEAYFMIVNQTSGKCLDLIGGSTANGAVTNQWTYDYNGQNQRWALQPTENGDHFKLISWVSGKAVSVSGDSTANSAQLWAWDYNSDPSQQWDLVDVGNGWYNIKNVRSGLLMDVSGSSTADNAKIQQYANTNSGAQRWRLQPWGSYNIRAAGGRYICVQGAGSTNGSPIIQYDGQNNPWFKWTFTSEGDGFYGLFSLNAPTRTISVVNGSVAAAANTQLWDYNVNNVGDQKVRILPKTSGKFKFYFKHDGMSWDMPGGNTANNVPLQQYPDNGFPWQEFSLERTP
ncbi:MAG: RICIN domain-containing protein, partial [Capsulimonas sp.]|uniref:RICIN domain-containing protein n=1 Tax=Capsulimonas sp. TaxID=2494211 RepID=UPI003262E212